MILSIRVRCQQGQSYQSHNASIQQAQVGTKLIQVVSTVGKQQVHTFDQSQHSLSPPLGALPALCHQKFGIQVWGCVG